MQKFKERWEISKNWQLLFPLFGVLALLYSGFKISLLFTSKLHLVFQIISGLLIAYLLLKICLFFFKKLKHKWVVKERWEMIRIFIVFAITGSSSAFIGRPLMKTVGITKENLNPLIYWVLFIVIGLVFYQILLVTFGWLFGQFQFFWEFEKKMLKRFGLIKDKN